MSTLRRTGLCNRKQKLVLLDLIFLFLTRLFFFTWFHFNGMPGSLRRINFNKNHRGQRLSAVCVVQSNTSVWTVRGVWASLSGVCHCWKVGFKLFAKRSLFILFGFICFRVLFFFSEPPVQFLNKADQSKKNFKNSRDWRLKKLTLSSRIQKLCDIKIYYHLLAPATRQARGY